MRGEFRHTHYTIVDAADGVGRADRVDLRRTVSSTDHMGPPFGAAGTARQHGFAAPNWWNSWTGQI